MKAERLEFLTFNSKHPGRVKHSQIKRGYLTDWQARAKLSCVPSTEKKKKEVNVDQDSSEGH
eukprot:1096605-Pelagomonas_calceolata.AAC.2